MALPGPKRTHPQKLRPRRHGADADEPAAARPVSAGVVAVIADGAANIRASAAGAG